MLIDSREQKPYNLPNSKIATLPHGDYSLEGVASYAVALERKSLADIYGCIAQHRDRFERELEHLARYKYAAVVIEASLPQFLTPPPYSQVHPKSAIGSVLAWSVKYRLPIFFAGDRRHGQALTRKLLEKFWQYSLEDAGHGRSIKGCANLR
jgi:ERCC4-type nuclease